MSESVTAFAPASIGNVAVGFDVLGLAISDAGDKVVARQIDGDRVVVSEVRGMDGEIHPFLSPVATENTASIAAQALLDEHPIDGTLELEVWKGVPLQSGMGSSAASAVAGVVAANEWLESPLPIAELLPYALEGEKYASGGLHADNVAPSLLGGLILCPQILLPEVVHLKVPSGISAVLIHPDLLVNTAQSRRGLQKSVPVKKWVDQQGLLAAFVTACANDDMDLIAKTLRDVVIEPQRAAAVVCFNEVVEAATKAGALGASLSGSGPSMFAWCRDADARNVASMMEQACRGQGIGCQSWISPLDAPGAHVISAA